MKIRVNFVSNSSSSNCIVVAKPLSQEYVKKIVGGKGKCENQLNAFAREGSLGDGQDFFAVSNDLLKAMCEYDIMDKFHFYDVFAIWEADYESTKTRKDFPKGQFAIFDVEIDYHTTDDVPKLLERYYKYEADTKSEEV